MKQPQRMVLVCVTLLLTGFAARAADRKVNLNVGWRFVKADPAGAEALAFDDSKWQTVSTPHTYNDVDTFDDWSPAGHKGEMNQWGGKTWYRKHIAVPAEWKDKTVIIEFEAIRQVADVYCNGIKVGRCENGFVPFGADLTKHLKFGENNVIAVACDNTFNKDSEGNGRSIWDHYGGGAKFPWNNPHWHPAHGGIYRNVYLHVSDKLHLTQPLYNNMETVGTYAYAIDPSRKSTGVGIEAEVANDSGSTQNFAVRSTLKDHTGKTIMTTEKQASLKSGERAVVKTEGTLDNPQLWEPGYPYLYRLVTEIVRDGVVVDSNEISFGVRWVSLSAETGFSINDRCVKLQGWGMKSVDGWPGLGAANPEWMHYYTLQKITDAGGNFVRWGHTAGGPIHLRASDQLGIITMQPGVDGESDISGHAWDVRLMAWRDVVIYYRNNPSLIVWEGGNQSVSEEHVKALKSIVTTYDPHGGRVYGHRRANNIVKPYSDLSISTEGSGYLSSLPTIEGEYNREESPRRVWDRQTPPYENWHAKGTYDLTAEQFAINQLYHYQKIAPRNHCGGANWIFVDSTSGGRVDSEVTRTSGEMDAMRLPKEAYHVCRVLFTDEPDIHVIGHWNYPKGTVKDVNVVGDCDEIALLVNGKEIGRKRSSTNDPGIEKKGKGKGKGKDVRTHPMLFTFAKVAWQPGTLEAIGYKNGKEIDRHVLKTAGPAETLKLTPMTGPGGLQADGSDVVVFDVEAIDKDGNRCPTFVGRVDFEMSGPGVWRGGYNSGKIKSTNNTYLDLESGINRVIIRSTSSPGTITLKAISQGLKPAMIAVESLPFPVKGGIADTLPVIPPQGTLIPLPPPVKTQTGGGETVKNVPLSSKLLEDVSYSGPAGKALVQKIRKGGRMFTDHTQTLPDLPAFLSEGEYIQLPNRDWNYSAVDLLQFNVKTDATVYVAHDAAIGQKMKWLADDFRDTGKTLVSGKHTWQLFSRKVKGGDSVLLGSNTEDQGNKRWMMTVFIVPDK